MPVFTYRSLITLSYSNTRRQLIRNLEHRGLSCISSGLQNKTDIRIPSIDSYLKRKVCLYVFDCLIGNVCMPFKNYFTRVSHNVNTRNRFSLIELPKMNLEFGRRSFSFLGASIFNSLPADIRTQLQAFIQAKGQQTFLFVIFNREFLYVSQCTSFAFLTFYLFKFLNLTGPL